MSLDWTANWIWLKDERDQDYIYAHARRVFDVAADASDAKLHVSANNIYRLYLNGQLVGRGPDRADPKYPYFDTYDITPLLKPGRNVLVFDVYCITSKANRGRAWCLYGGGPGLLAELRWSESGQEKRVVTDESWRMVESPAWRQAAPIISRFVGFAEHYDANAAESIAGYRDAGFDDSVWETPGLLGVPPDGPVGDPLPREQPLLERRVHPARSLGSIQRDGLNVQHLPGPLGFVPEAPLTVAAPPGAPATLTAEFERSMGGLIEVVLDDCSGGAMDIYYGENTNLILCDTVELPSRGSFRFEPFDWRGAKHVSLTLRDLGEPLTVLAVNFIELQYPFQDVGEFETDDPALGRIWRACRATAHAGVKDHPVDCVHREQALWYGDMYVHIRAAAACFGDATPFVKACRQAVRNVNTAGVLAVPGPVTDGYEYDGETLGWSEQPLTVPMSIAALCDYTGEPELAIFAADAVKRMMAHFARYEDDRGLIEVNKSGLQGLIVFTGWAMMLKQEGVPTNVNAEYAMSLDACARIMRLAGDGAAAESYAGKAARVRQAITERFYSREEHLFIDGEKEGQPLRAFCPTVNGLATLAGCLPEGEAGAWARAVETHPEMGQLTSPFDASTLLEAFFVAGADDQARRLLDACWGAFVARGEPCVPERWMDGHDSLLLYGIRGTSSRCHPYGAGPAYCFHRYLLGVRPTEPAFRRVNIEPRAMGLRVAWGRVPTPAGELSVFWRRDRNAWYLEATLPEGVEATITLPRFGWGAGRMIRDGAVVWEDDGWARIDDERWRKPHRDQHNRISATVDSPGRHTVLLEKR